MAKITIDSVNRRTLEEIDETLTMLQARRAELGDGAFDPDLVDALVSVARIANTMRAEQRQRERLEARAYDRLTARQIVARLRQLDANEQEHVATELARMRSKKVNLFE